MSDNAQNLTRKQLAQFLPDQRAVRMFENLLKQVNTIIPGDTSALYTLVQEVYADAAEAGAKAAQALDALERIASALELLALGPTDSQLTTDDPSPPTTQASLEDNLAPPAELGTISAQQADNVVITGGAITADLTNNQTVLLKTSVALANGAAAAAGTLANAPAAGNPTKWVPINDNGTTRYIPAW